MHGQGGDRLAGGQVDSAGDHRVAMALAVAALAAAAPVRIAGWEAVATSYPAFEEDYRCVCRCHSHRRAGRLGQVDRRPGRGRPARARLPRHRGHVPGGGLRGHAPGHRPRRRRPRSAELAREIDSTVGDKVIVDGVDATIEIRSPEVTRAVSIGGRQPRRPHGDGRSASGSGRRPTAEEWSRGATSARWCSPTPTLKVYLTADDGERASRRSKEMLDLHYDQVAADIARRDHIDSTRAASPLSVADDAVRIDTTGRDIDDVVDEVLGLAAAGSTARDARR